MWVILEWLLLVLILSPFEILVALWIGKRVRNRKKGQNNDS